MLLDVRTYTCKPGTMKSHLALYEQFGKPVQVSHLGAPLLYATCETGNPNEYIHIWCYRHAADREQRKPAQRAPLHQAQIHDLGIAHFGANPVAAPSAAPVATLPAISLLLSP